MTKENVISILVNEKSIPETIKDSEVYVFHYTEPGEDSTVTASRTSIHLFKTIERLAEFLCKESGLEIGLETEDDLRKHFQNDGAEEAYVWDVIILEVEV